MAFLEGVDESANKAHLAGPLHDPDDFARIYSGSLGLLAVAEAVQKLPLGEDFRAGLLWLSERSCSQGMHYLLARVLAGIQQSLREGEIDSTTFYRNLPLLCASYDGG